jgi:hypothetical protein
MLDSLRNSVVWVKDVLESSDHVDDQNALLSDFAHGPQSCGCASQSPGPLRFVTPCGATVVRGAILVPYRTVPYRGDLPYQSRLCCRH